MKRTPFSESSCALFVLSSLIAVTFLGASPVAQSPTAFQTRWQSGTPATVTGELMVMYADDFANKRSEVIHTLRDERTGKTFRLRFENAAPGDLRSGMRVTARGHALESEIYLAAADGTVTVQSGTFAASAPVTGDQKTLVIVTNFSDKTLNPLVPGADCSDAAISDRMFTDPVNNSVDDLYRDTSGTKVSFSGQVVGPYTLNFASTDQCDLNAWSQGADAQAAAAGVNLAAYPRKVYVMPSNPVCGAAGIGELGVTPSRAWVFTCDRPHVYAHEIGHNLGMHHSSTPTDEYGDDSDPMGSNGNLKPVNAAHKVQMGWVPDTQVVAVTQDGLYNVAPLSLDATSAAAPQVLSVSRPDSTDYYYLSYRRGTTGFEANVSSEYQDRINVHRWAGGGNMTYLLAVLADGETFVDSSNGFTVTQVSHGTSYATARVQLGTGCGHVAPSVSLSPRDQSGLSGTAINYDVALLNNDASACAASTFSLTGSGPSGWTASTSLAVLQVAPGATGHATLTVPSPSGASSGVYTVGVAVSDSANVGHNASATGTYTVLAGDTTPPTAPKAPVAKLKGRTVYLSWVPTTDNVGVAGYRVWRNGAVIGTTAAQSWTDGSVASGSTDKYWLVAFDAAGNVSAPGNSVTVSIASTKGR